MGDSNNNLYKQKNKQLKDKFRILVFGGFGSGKSSVINALLGQHIMPIYPIPIPIVVKYGKKNESVLHFGFLSDSLQLDVLPHKIREHIQLHGMRAVPPLSIDLSGWEAVLNFSYNDEIPWIYHDGIIEEVELSAPVDILKEDVEIIEMPSLCEETISLKYTYDYLSSANIILFILSACAPCSRAEMDFIKHLSEMGYNNIIFVVNRYDLIRDKDKEALKKFIRMKLSDITKKRYLLYYSISNIGMFRTRK